MRTSDVIKVLRTQRGLTQADLAAALGWERSTIAAIERGHDRPGAKLVEALASFFQVSTDHILGRDGKPQPASAQSEAEAELLALFRDTPKEGQAAVIATLRALIATRQ